MLGSRYIELIHDELVSIVWPGTDPIQADEYRDRGLIESAAARPFQCAFGVEIFPSIAEKGSALFHSLISNHPFHNGNKRTAVVALDIFFTGNGYMLILSNDAMYKLIPREKHHRRRITARDTRRNKGLCYRVRRSPRRSREVAPIQDGI